MVADLHEADWTIDAESQREPRRRSRSSSRSNHGSLHRYASFSGAFIDRSQRMNVEFSETPTTLSIASQKFQFHLGLHPLKRAMGLPCFPARRVSTETAEPAPDTWPGIEFNYINRDDSEDTGGIFETFVPGDQVTAWLARICKDVMIRLGYLPDREWMLVPPRRVVHFYVVREPGVAWTDRDKTGHVIHTHLSSLYLRDVLNSPGGHMIMKRELPGVLTHELTHAFQWDALGTAPGCLIEGVADWTRVKNGYAPIGWRVPRPAPKNTPWTDESATWFLIWLDEPHPLFVQRLNQMMATHKFEESFFYFLTGSDVDDLWKRYQRWLAKHQAGGLSSIFSTRMVK
ncbi:peptidase of plants and bacteria-domain-containing protein [Hyaloraphidium curvatum]|nr:peptidase of plants and bacteria-domain-containing protein [Hyaloraphidium curvatum]